MSYTKQTKVVLYLKEIYRRLCIYEEYRETNTNVYVGLS